MAGLDGLATIKVVVYDGKGGPLKNAIPVKTASEDRGYDLGHAVNGDELRMADASKLTAAQAKEVIQFGWAAVLKEDGSLLFPSPTGVNWVEQRGHLKAVVEIPPPEPSPVPSPPAPLPEGEGKTMRMRLVKVEYLPEGQVFTWEPLH